MKKKLTIEERRQMARERRSKIMKLAHQLKNDEGLTLSNALKLAHMTAELLYWLRKGKVYFAYFKKTKEPHSMVNSKHIMRFNYIFNI